VFDPDITHDMSKLFIGEVRSIPTVRASLTLHRGLAWHTDDQALRQKFEEFGQVEEAVSYSLLDELRCIGRTNAYIATGRG
jgi:hypothetical protein